MKINRTIKIIAKLFVIIAAYSFIIYKISTYPKLSQFVDSLKNTIQTNWAILFLLILLMLLNWLIEAIKWQYLIAKFEKIKLINAFNGIFAGVTVSIFTPNRVGEFAGRIFVISEKNRISAILSTIVGSLSQLLVTIITGFISIGLLFYFYPEKLANIELQPILISVFSVIVSILSIYLYFNVKLLEKLFSKIRFLSKYKDHFKIFSAYQSKELFIVLLISTIRYFVFAIQFYLTLQFFNVEIHFYQAFIAIALSFFINTIIPTVAIAEIGIRGSVAIFAVGLFSPQVVAILSSSILLWVINLAIPAIIGSIIIAKYK